MLKEYVDVKEGKYYLNGVRLRAVTKFIEEFKRPFDRETISKRVAKRDNIPVAEVLAQWKAKGEQSRTAGASLHQYIHDVLNDTLDDPLGMMTKTLEMVAFDNFLVQADSLELKGVEYPVGDFEWQLGGRLDAIFYSKKTGSHHVFDWKRGGVSTYNRWENLVGPFEEFNGSDLNYYGIQVWLYTLMLERNVPTVSWGVPYVVGLQTDGEFQAYAAPRDVKEVIQMVMNGQM